MTNTTIPQAIREFLALEDVELDQCTVTHYGALDDVEHGYAEIADDATVVILPGWIADDGGAEVEYPDAESGRAAARQYAEDGDYGDRDHTLWIHVWAWRRGYVLDVDGDPVELHIDRDRHTVTLEPSEPDCCADEHDWQSPHEVLGGLEENPGVWGYGGGVMITEVCAHCGVYQITDTWAQDPSTGEQGLTSVSYRDADDESLEWVASREAAGA